MNTRYIMTTAYSDFSSKTEHSDDLMALLRAAGIYWEDPSCEYIHVWDTIAHMDVMCFSRPS